MNEWGKAYEKQFPQQNNIGCYFRGNILILECNVLKFLGAVCMYISSKSTLKLSNVLRYCWAVLLSLMLRSI